MENLQCFVHEKRARGAGQCFPECNGMIYVFTTFAEASKNFFVKTKTGKKNCKIIGCLITRLAAVVKNRNGQS